MPAPPRRRRLRVVPSPSADRAVRGEALRSSSATPLLLAVALCLMALLVAPEQPEAQEAICQRHNGVAACRVW